MFGTSQVGFDRLGLPIGLQFIGRPWSEATLIHLAFAMQVKFLSVKNIFLFYIIFNQKIITLLLYFFLFLKLCIGNSKTEKK